jgi:ribosomal protein L16 Arg81 hydroxylase
MLEDCAARLHVPDLARLLARREVVLRRAVGEAPAPGGWNALRALIEDGSFPVDRLCITRGGVVVAPVIYLDRGAVRTEQLAKLMARGASVIVGHIDRYFPALAARSAEVRATTREKSWFGAIVSTGEGGALMRHYDPDDLLILQVEGSKRWLIHGNAVPDPVENPPPGHADSAGEVVFDEVLHPGDLLFVPAGHWHRCENRAQLSMHLGLFVSPPSGCKIAERLLSEALAEPLLRKPLTRLADPAARAAHEAAVKAWLVARVEQVSLDELIAAHACA